MVGWKRAEHFSFFSAYQEPFYGVTVNIDCTNAYNYCKRNGISFFLYYMHKSILASNQVEELKYRTEDGMPICFDTIHASTTVLNKNDLFSFALLPFQEKFDLFLAEAFAAVEKAKLLDTIGLNEDSKRIDVIHYSTIPWFSFTAITHERNYSIEDSIPKITFGKYFKQGNKLLLPVSVFAHHGLVDGLHIGLYYSKLEYYLSAEL